MDIAPSGAVEHVQYGYGYSDGHSAHYLRPQAIRQEMRRERGWDARGRAWRYGY